MNATRQSLSVRALATLALALLALLLTSSAATSAAAQPQPQLQPPPPPEAAPPPVASQSARTSRAARTAPSTRVRPPPPSAHREYLQRLVLVLDGIRRTLRWVEMHPGNEPLARFSLPLAQQYVTMTGHMTPTPDLRLLHPHLLLIAENAERAIAAHGGGDVRGYRAHLRTVREELRTLQSVLHHLEIELPEIPR